MDLQHLTASPSEALATSAKLVQDDLVLMVEREGKSLQAVSNVYEC